MQTGLTYASAFALGLLHSLEPSHAKAVLASYFLNRRRTVAEAVAFALTVTLAHTLSIYALAALGWFVGPILRGDAVETGSRLLGGLLMVGLGAWMLRGERRVHPPGNETCACDHAHGHFFHHPTYHHDHPAPSSLRQAFVLGFCSGVIPCLSGLAVLLMAWSTGSPSHGMALVAVFSAGLGLVVLVLSLTMQQAAQVMDRYWKGAARWSRHLPVLSATLIFLFGVAVLVSTLMEQSGH